VLRLQIAYFRVLFRVTAAQVRNGLPEAVVSSSLQTSAVNEKLVFFNFHTVTGFFDRLTGIVVVVLTVMFVI